VHCNIQGISSNQLLSIDTSNSKVYLYVREGIDFGGKGQLQHLSSRSTNGEVIPSGYNNINLYQEDVFRFQIRGGPAGSLPVTYKFSGQPTSNLLFWAPAATLDLRGGAVFSSALFVNRVTVSKNTTINLSNVPGSFISDFKNNLSGTTQSSTAQGTVYTKFY
jgi:hypothetical protein